MKLTPLDIRKQEFKKVLRGYDPVEVDSFLEMMSNEFSEMLRENKEVKDQLLEFDVQLRDFKQMEKTLQQTLVQAQEATGKSVDNAKREAQLILQEAEFKASQIQEKARIDVMHAKEEIIALRSKKESLVSRLKILLNSEIELIKAIEQDENERERDLSRGTGKESIQIDEILNKL